jgi:hypothetical protein
MLKLHKISEVRVYCGPGAIIALTGKPLSEARSAINRAIGRRENIGITRIPLTYLEGALENLNIQFLRHVCAERKTLQQLVETNLKKDVRYVVHITGHYVTILNGHLVDNHYRFGTDVNDCRWKSKMVKNYLEISDN